MVCRQLPADFERECCQVFEEVLPEIQEQILDDLEVGTLDEEGFEGIFPKNDDPSKDLN